MADTYLSISTIANDEFMNERLNACVVQQLELGSIDIGTWGTGQGGALSWVVNNRYLWAASPGWGAAWDYALAENNGPNYEPGQDATVITDEMILEAVQQLAPLPPT